MSDLVPAPLRQNPRACPNNEKMICSRPGPVVLRRCCKDPLMTQEVFEEQIAGLNFTIGRQREEIAALKATLLVIDARDLAHRLSNPEETQDGDGEIVLALLAMVQGQMPN